MKLSVLFESDVRFREHQQAWKSGKIDDYEYYRSLLRRGKSQTVTRLASLDDKTAQELINYSENFTVTSHNIPYQIEKYCEKAEDREFIKMIGQYLANWINTTQTQALRPEQSENSMAWSAQTPELPDLDVPEYHADRVEEIIGLFGLAETPEDYQYIDRHTRDMYSLLAGHYWSSYERRIVGLISMTSIILGYTHSLGNINSGFFIIGNAIMIAVEIGLSLSEFLDDIKNLVLAD